MPITINREQFQPTFGENRACASSAFSNVRRQARDVNSIATPFSLAEFEAECRRRYPATLTFATPTFSSLSSIDPLTILNDGRPMTNITVSMGAFCLQTMINVMAAFREESSIGERSFRVHFVRVVPDNWAGVDADTILHGRCLLNAKESVVRQLCEYLNVPGRGADVWVLVRNFYDGLRVPRRVANPRFARMAAGTAAPARTRRARSAYASVVEATPTSELAREYFARTEDDGFSPEMLAALIVRKQPSSEVRDMIYELLMAGDLDSGRPSEGVA